jgi:hypothetical protein
MNTDTDTEDDINKPFTLPERFQQLGEIDKVRITPHPIPTSG